MQIEIIDNDRYIGANIVPGKYSIFPYEDGTLKQGAAFHALISEYWASGCSSYQARSFPHFRALIKLYLGAGMEKFYNLANTDGTPCPVGRTDYRLKSWRDYTKKERKESIDRLIAEMVQAGVNSRKFNEILQGMENKQCAV